MLAETKEKLEAQRQNLKDCQQLLVDLQVHDHFAVCAASLAARTPDYENICDADHAQAQDYQKEYASFEKSYFKGLNDVIDGLKADQANEAGVEMDE